MGKRPEEIAESYSSRAAAERRECAKIRGFGRWEIGAGCSPSGSDLKGMAAEKPLFRHARLSSIVLPVWKGVALYIIYPIWISWRSVGIAE